MREKAGVLALFAAVSVFAVVAFRSAFASKPVLADGPKVIGTITCDPSDGAIAAANGSTGAPGLTSADCAQELSDLTKLGIDLEFVTSGSFGYSATTAATFALNFTVESQRWARSRTEASDVAILKAATPAYGDGLEFEDGSADVPSYAVGSDVADDLGDLLNKGYSLRFTSNTIPGQGGMPGTEIYYILEKSHHE